MNKISGNIDFSIWEIPRRRFFTEREREAHLYRVTMANTNQIVVTALKYDKEWTNSDIGVTNPKFRQLVSWLEDTKVRRRKRFCSKKPHFTFNTDK